MATPLYVRSPFGVLKRVKISPTTPAVRRHYTNLSMVDQLKLQGLDIEEIAAKRGIQVPETPQYEDPEIHKQIEALRLPRNVQAVQMRPMRRTPTYGLPVCDLQLRTYSVRNVELFADFAMRAAYYLNLPAKGPIPLPRIVERWTVPRSPFIFKKSQENFERITLRRLIQIQDGHPEVVQIWLAYLRKNAYHGIGMKANVWEFDRIGVGKEMEKAAEEAKDDLDAKWKLVGRRKDGRTYDKVVELLESEPFKAATYGHITPVKSVIGR